MAESSLTNVQCVRNEYSGKAIHTDSHVIIIIIDLLSTIARASEYRLVEPKLVHFCCALIYRSFTLRAFQKKDTFRPLVRISVIISRKKKNWIANAQRPPNVSRHLMNQKHQHMRCVCESKAMRNAIDHFDDSFNCGAMVQLLPYWKFEINLM